MSITTVKVLRTISKIVLLIVGIGIIGYGGLMVYKSVVNKPQRVRITNVTDSAATITWVTDNPVRGVVYYKDEGSFLPGPLSVLGSKVAYDDRDFARAQDDCVKAFNENAKNTKDEDFAVDGNNFDCENIPVEKLGAYYTHSVTIKDLENSSTYFFVVGNGIWSWSVDGVDKDVSENDIAIANSFNFKTSPLLEKIPTPNIAYGTVYAGVKSEEGYLSEALSKDSLVYAYLVVDEKNSQVISSVTNTTGGWIFDKSNFRDTEGNLITDLSKATMMVCAQYEDVEDAKCKEVSEGLDGDTELDVQGNDLEDLDMGTKNRILERFEQLVGKVYAVGPDNSCPSPLPTITDDSTFTCDKDCDSDWSVSGCGVGSSCMKKCTHISKTKYGTWESRDWVKFGTVPGTCNVPGVCGECSDGDVEDDKKTCKHKICQAGNWSAWKDGLHDGAACTPDTGGGGDNDYNDECSSGELGKCNSNGERCKLKGGYRKWEKDATCNNEAVEYCAGGSLKVGICSNGKKCTAKGGAIIENNSCKCHYGEGYYNPGVCIGYSGKRCNSGLAAIVDGNCPKSGESCKIQPYYTETWGETGKCLGKCDLTCGGITKQISASDCKKLGIIECKYGDDADPQNVQVTAIIISDLNLSDIKRLMAIEPDTKAVVEGKLESELKKLSDWKCGEEKVSMSDAIKYCKALGGTGLRENNRKECTDGTALHEADVTCNGASANNPKNQSFKFTSYAQDDPSDGYTLYLPEYGMYSFELGDYKLKTETTDGETYYLFYIEANDKAGFQMPEDPENPTADEDIMLKSSSAAIKYAKVSSAQAYTLEKGINIISFNFIPVSTELGTLTAGQVIEQAAKKDVDIQYISSFEGGRWAKGYTCKNDKCSGNDFNIIPGKGYLVYVTEGGDISIGGYDLKSSIPVNLSGGWNLVGIHGYTNAYTAASLIESINKVEGLTSDNVTWWPTSKAMYEGLQVTGTQQYGFDFPISPTNGYFVRVSSFKPEDNKCKSLLWNEGGTLNGACGVTK